jgi:hypothetical protein
MNGATRSQSQDLVINVVSRRPEDVRGLIESVASGPATARPSGTLQIRGYDERSRPLTASVSVGLEDEGALAERVYAALDRGVTCIVQTTIRARAVRGLTDRDTAAVVRRVIHRALHGRWA